MVFIADIKTYKFQKRVVNPDKPIIFKVRTKKGFPLFEIIKNIIVTFNQELNYKKNMKVCPECGVKNRPESDYCEECNAEFDKITIKIFCSECNSENEFDDKFCCDCGALLNKDVCPECGSKIKKGKKFCSKCGYSIIKTIEEKKFKELEVQPKTGEIKCPFCNEMFKPAASSWTGEIQTQKTTSTSGNIARGLVFLPWGVVSAVKNKKFIQCPHCKMKIMQG